ncbi:MAG TPA: hypothetical protein VMK12_23665 [Anaeromyxobacteraceae bacterium]|nr:hypothetical protein [Anaeromyxobacteraceae bacterium]
MNIWLLVLLALVGMVWQPFRGLEWAVECAARPRTRGTSMSAQPTFTAAHDVGGDERSALENGTGTCRDGVALQRAALNPLPSLNSVPRDVRVRRRRTSTPVRHPLDAQLRGSLPRSGGAAASPSQAAVRYAMAHHPQCDNGQWAAGHGFVKNHARCGTAHFAPGYS